MTWGGPMQGGKISGRIGPLRQLPYSIQYPARFQASIPSGNQIPSRTAGDGLGDGSGSLLQRAALANTADIGLQLIIAAQACLDEASAKAADIRLALERPPFQMRFDFRRI